MVMYEIYRQQNGIELVTLTKCQLTAEFMVSLLFHSLSISNLNSKEVQLAYFDANNNAKVLMRYRNYKGYGFALPNFSFELLVKKISPINILKLVCALLLERKVILLFQNYQQNAIIMESLISLLTPLYFSDIDSIIANGIS